MEIIDISAEVADGHDQRRDIGTCHGIMVHRVGVDDQTGVVIGYDGLAISEAFTGRRPEWEEVAKVTGHQNAYTLYLGGDWGPPKLDGKIWQALPLDEIGHHARRFSKLYIGIGCIGDFRAHPPSPAQWAALVDVCVELCTAFNWNPYKRIKGHGEEPRAHGGEKAPGQPAACPGDLLNMYALRDDVAFMIKELARRRLHESGLVFSRS